MRLPRILMLVCLAAILPAVAIAQKTTYDFDRTATFSNYRTYAFKPGSPSKDPFVDQRIVSGIEAQLALKGFTKTDTAPDVYIVYHAALNQKQDISTYSIGPAYGGFGWGWGPGWGSTAMDVRVKDITVGTLAIDMIDAEKKQVVWRGLGVKEIDLTAGPEKRDEKVAKAVEKIFKHYPPKVGS